MNESLKILSDMSAALGERAGIPQVARQMTWLLSRMPGIDLSNLILSIHGSSIADRYSQRKQPPISMVEDAEYLADALGSQEKERVDPLRPIRRILRTLSPRPYPLIPIAPGQFQDVIWENYFAPSLPASCRELLDRTRFYRSPLTRRELTTRLRLNLPAPRLETEGFDFVIFQNPINIRVSPGTIKLIRCHDLVPLFRFDTQPPSRHLIRDYYHVLSLCAKDSHFVCVSEATRNELLSLYPHLQKKSFVVPNSVALPFWQNEHKDAAPGEPYFLTVGTIEPRKNYLRLFDAFRIYRRTQPNPIRLVLIGNSGWHNQKELGEIKAAEQEGWLTWHQNVFPGRLVDFYRDAYALISASVHEGFGLPPLEAAAMGTPSILSDLPTFRNHLGEAAEYFDPHNPLSMAQAFSRFDLQRRAGLAKIVREKAARFQPSCEMEGWREVFTQLRPDRT